MSYKPGSFAASSRGTYNKYQSSSSRPSFGGGRPGNGRPQSASTRNGGYRPGGSSKPSYSSNRASSGGYRPNTSAKPSGYTPNGGNRSFGNSGRSGGYSSGGSRGFNKGGSRFARRRPESKLVGQTDIFIKKAVQNVVAENYTPKNAFTDFKLSTPLQENIARRGYTTPTPIQDQSIEPILAGRDLIGLASTGTGKTAAFLLPVIDKLFRDRDQKVLVVAPTRELAVQIADEFRQFSAGMKLYSTVVVGGASMQRQMHEIRRNPHVIIGTPGRLKDLIERSILRLDEFRTIVLDEVDLMVDIGFINDVKYFISLLPKVRQSLFFSATISPKVQSILHDFVTDPVTVKIQQVAPSENVDQDVIKIISRDQKIEQLHELLIKDGFNKVLIFGRTKYGVEDLQKQLSTRGFKVGAIHGNKKQGHRQRTLDSFKKNQIQILLATDVASRGLDIDNVTHVINYDIPESYEDYIHRIGRTGRADRKGVALTFVD